MPDAEFDVQVAEDDRGVCAFVMYQPSRHNLLFIDAFEGEFFNGVPTFRGTRGMRMLEAWLRNMLKETGKQAFGIVDKKNLPYKRVLKHLGWTSDQEIYRSNYS
jgi:hypothetical protein